jgi:hypothetical protein
LGDYYWSVSGCCCPTRPDVEWKGYPGSGSYYRTDRFGTYWVGGGVHSTYASHNYECGTDSVRIGPPVKEYQWLSEFGAYGQWFESGVIYYRNGAWRIEAGDWGQTAGRLAEGPEAEPPDDAEVPPDAPAAGPPLRRGAPPGPPAATRAAPSKGAGA